MRLISADLLGKLTKREDGAKDFAAWRVFRTRAASSFLSRRMYLSLFLSHLRAIFGRRTERFTIPPVLSLPGITPRRRLSDVFKISVCTRRPSTMLDGGGSRRRISFHLPLSLAALSLGQKAGPSPEISVLRTRDRNGVGRSSTDRSRNHGGCPHRRCEFKTLGSEFVYTSYTTTRRDFIGKGVQTKSIFSRDVRFCFSSDASRYRSFEANR